MRFLNDFKIFEAEFIRDRDLIDYHIINDLKDILLELDDEGLESRIWVNGVRTKREFKNESIGKIEIEISPDNNFMSINLDIVDDVIQRIKSYLKDFNLKISLYKDDGSVVSDSTNNKPKDAVEDQQLKALILHSDYIFIEAKKDK